MANLMDNYELQTSRCPECRKMLPMFRFGFPCIDERGQEHIHALILCKPCFSIFIGKLWLMRHKFTTDAIYCRSIGPENTFLADEISYDECYRQGLFQMRKT